MAIESGLSLDTICTGVGGLIILKPDKGSPIQYAATASFLSKLYEDYLNLQQRSGFRCGNKALSLKMLHTFSVSQVRLYSS